MPQPLESRLHVNGLDLCLFEWPGEGRPIFLAHATGFHARCWDQVVAQLPGRHVYALDMRGHGRSDKPEPPYPWPAFGDDVAEVARRLGLRDAIGVGHSKGGYAVTRAAALVPGAFAALLLLDPVIMPREAYGEQRMNDHFAARRRNEWASVDEMFERFAGRAPFDAWDRQVLRDYCEYGLLPNPDGEGFVLACPPAIEAAVYAGSVMGGVVYEDMAHVDIPVRVIRARSRTGKELDMSSSPTTPDLAAHFARGVDVHLPNYSHFIPMEDPAFAAREILALEALVEGTAK